jgi:hypothetical protein
LYIASSIRDKIDGHFEPSLETLNKKGDAVRIVMEVLRIHGNHVPPSVVMAVSFLAVGCVSDDGICWSDMALTARDRQWKTNWTKCGITCKPWNELSGLWVEWRSSTLTCKGFVHGEFFQPRRSSMKMFTKSCARNVHCVAAALQLAPVFACPTFSQMDPLPLAFLDDARIRAWRTVKRLPKDSSFLFEMMLRLHQIGLAASDDWYDEVDPRALSNLCFEALQNVAALGR